MSSTTSPSSSQWSELCRRLATLEVPGEPDALRAAGARAVRWRLPVLSWFLPPAWLYPLVLRWSPAMAWASIETLLRRRGTDQLEAVVRLPDMRAGGHRLLQAQRGFFEQLPVMLGLEPARVSLITAQGRGVFEIRLPPSRTLGSRLYRALRVMGGAALQEEQVVPVQPDAESRLSDPGVVERLGHAIRTPLNGVVGAAELLHRGGGLPPNEQRLSAALRDSAQELQRVIERFLDGIPLSASPVDDPLSRSRVLIAEDDRVCGQLLAALLQRRGYDAQVVPNGQAAVAAISAGAPFALVLLDCHMPVMDGFEATAQIRSLAPEVPIVAVSADSQPEVVDRFRALGADDFMGKPLTDEKLASLLGRWAHAQHPTPRTG